jgi:hypothetical protein
VELLRWRADNKLKTIVYISNLIAPSEKIANIVAHYDVATSMELQPLPQPQP